VIELQHFTLNDIDRLLQWIDSPQFLVQWTGAYFSYPLTREKVEEHIQKSRGMEPECLIYKAVKVPEGKVIGHIELDRINRGEKTAAACRVLVDPAEQGRGYGTQMMEKILDIGFEELLLKKIYLSVFTYNERAIQCYRKVGFRIETLIEKRWKAGNTYWNSYRMSIHATDWRNRKLKLNSK
jgi:RimJ/RimL family protein N-acetyltransferase